MRSIGPAARALFSGFFLLACLGGTGCEDEKKPSLVDAGAPPVSSGPVLGGKLGAAVAAAESMSASPSSPSAKSGDGPPEGGIFKPGEADKIVSKGAQPKLDLLGEGADPKVALAPSIEPGASQAIAIVVAVRQGPQHQLPTLEFGVAFEIDKPKDAKDDKPKDGAAPVRVVGKVKSVKADPAQRASLPKDLLDALDKLKGSEVRFALSPNGGGSDWAYTLAKGADPQFDLLLRPLVDALSLVVVPLPKKPVGQGAYWMVTDRAPSSGIDVIRYRVVRVESIAPDAVSLSIDIREYAADDRFDLPVGQEAGKIALDQLDSQGKGTLDVAPKTFLPSKAEVDRKTQARLKGGPQGRQMALQLETTAKLSSPAR